MLKSWGDAFPSEI